jgi:catechol 2,3-dioxygenase-like lactoylglutathione lyase family enzyme
MSAARVHHSALRVHDLQASLRFYADGIGLAVLMDHRFAGDWPTLFHIDATELRSVFLGDPRHPDAGIVELVAFDGAPARDRRSGGESGTERGGRAHGGEGAEAGFFLLSFTVDVEEVLGRLEALGVEPEGRIEQPAPVGTVAMATVRDPDGVLVELIDVPKARPPRRRPARPARSGQDPGAH